MSTNVKEIGFNLIITSLYTLLEYCFKTPLRVVFAHFGLLKIPFGVIVVDALKELGIIRELGN